MLKDESARPVKRVRVIEQKSEDREEIKKQYRQLRVLAYCRVSTKQEEQLNSYETQKNYYTELINKNPDWKLIKIFADKGITGTSVKKRDEFNKMIRLCKQGKADMIICKSISRFARNTVDCLHYTRMLKEFGVDVYFEEQQIHSTQPGAEFYITIYGSIAQSESENISANIKWGKAQSAKEGYQFLNDYLRQFVNSFYLSPCTVSAAFNTQRNAGFCPAYNAPPQKRDKTFLCQNVPAYLFFLTELVTLFSFLCTVSTK